MVRTRTHSRSDQNAREENKAGAGIAGSQNFVVRAIVRIHSCPGPGYVPRAERLFHKRNRQLFPPKHPTFCSGEFVPQINVILRSDTNLC
jgi:hypothetical protein